MRRRPAAAQRSGRDQSPLRRGSGAFAALPPRHDKPFEHRRRLPFRRRDAAYRRRAGGQNPRARRYDPHRMPGKRAPYRRQAHHGRGTRRRQDTAGEVRHFGHPSRGDVRPDRADAGSAPGIPRPDGRHAGHVRPFLGVSAAPAAKFSLYQPQPLLLRRGRRRSSTRRPCVRKWYCSARSRRAPIRHGAKW